MACDTRWMPQSATPATQKTRWMSPSATPATQSGARPGRPSAPKRATRASPVLQVPRLRREIKVDVTKCHTCHAKPRWMSPSATPTQRGTAPRATQRAQARHQSQPSAPSAMPATRNEGGCHQVHRMPRKMKWKMVCDKDGVWKMVKVGVWKMVGDKVGVWEMVCMKDGVWQSCVWKMVWQRWCVKDGESWRGDKVVCERWSVTKMVCERWWKLVCERWCVTKLCVKDVCQSCVWKMVCERWCVWKMVCVCERWCVTKLCVKDGCEKVVCERWCVTRMGGGGRGGGGGIQNQKQEPHTKMWEQNDCLNLNVGFVYLSIYSIWSNPLQLDHLFNTATVARNR